MAYLWSGGRAGSGSRRSTEELRERWRSRSVTSCWNLPGDWWAPAVEAVVEAVCDGRGMARACARLGQARGRAGVGIGEALDDLGALFSVLDWPDPPLPLVRCTAQGWVDAGMMALAAENCEDPLTGLTTVAYLRGRLAELYRAIRISPPPAPLPPDAPLRPRPPTDADAVLSGHCLVMVDLSDGSEPWRRLARSVVVAQDLRAVFPDGETLTMVGTGRAAALVPLEPDLEQRVERLRNLLALTLASERSFLDSVHPPGRSPDDGRPGGESFLVWIERLPASLPRALDLLEALAR
ncbi:MULTISPECIES: hypothetical protein [Actinomadura]|uniref:Uncharacterized protein n=1 Tax=Actinomadura yumaensis TaxID=111807 RepID=A0ABW2CSC2_9ACTN|nr:hypothetical protein [Actinomadura sp. J1-007]MWK35043.1 hypothetical protein [Actinomadura sp. J1-007]